MNGSKVRDGEMSTDPDLRTRFGESLKAMYKPINLHSTIEVTSMSQTICYGVGGGFGTQSVQGDSLSYKYYFIKNDFSLSPKSV